MDKRLDRDLEVREETQPRDRVWAPHHSFQSSKNNQVGHIDG